MVSGNLGISSLVTKELDHRDGRAAGSSFTAKIGYLNNATEIGVYSTNINSKTSVTHDGISADLQYLINSTGAYLAHYRNRLYFEIGYGKASIKEQVTTDLTGAALAAMKEVYNLDTSGEFASTEARALVGVKLFSLGVATVTVYGQKIKMLETSHDETNFGFELKLTL